MKISNLEQKIAVEERIGEGGTANIVKGRFTDPSLIAQSGILHVAVKYVDFSVSEESFRYEITIMSKLPKNHPNIVMFLGYGDSPRSMVLKFYQMSLKGLLASPDFERSESTIYDMVFGIANGMKAIHEKNIIHFDLKPQNILIDVMPDLTFNCVICDFGFANFVNDGKRQLVAGMKAPNAVGLTLRYAAPEVI